MNICIGQIIDKKDCCGCSACKGICPVKCITMTADKEGFLYPHIDYKSCKNCGLCKKVCSVINKGNYNSPNELNKAFIVQNRNKKELYQSTSGGFFTVLAKYVIKHNGVVFGAAYNEQFVIQHTYVEDNELLEIFRNSKYAQSNINSCYFLCKEFLEKGRMVMFSGTPCQIAGLKMFLGKKYSNLLKIDFICRGVISPLLFKNYIGWMGKIEDVKNIRFRDKHYGYLCSCMSFYYKNNKVLSGDNKADSILRLFFKDLCSRPSCYNCVFRSFERQSDFTAFDCWHASLLSKKFDNSGATAVIVRSNTAAGIMSDILEEEMISEETDIGKLLRLDGMLMTEGG